MPGVVGITKSGLDYAQPVCEIDTPPVPGESCTVLHKARSGEHTFEEEVMADDKVSPADKALEKAFAKGDLPEKERRAPEVIESSAARQARASTGAPEDAEKAAEVAREAAGRRREESQAVEDAAPTGADFPERAAENIQGHQTAGEHPLEKEHSNSRAQTEPAILTKDGGTVPHGFISSPTGFVPASTAEQLTSYQTRLKQSENDGKVSEETLRKMSKPEIRAAAHDRGINVGQGGKESLIRRFIAAQGEEDADRETRETRTAKKK